MRTTTPPLRSTLMSTASRRRRYVAAIAACLLAVVILVPRTALAQTEAQLLGNHRFALQWISWDRFGTAIVSPGTRPGEYFVTGYQPGTASGDAKRAGDYLSLNGTITEFTGSRFRFEGTIVVKVDTLEGDDGNAGTACIRRGSFTFAATGGRRFWRLQEMQSPCGGHVDYVDIFMR